MHRVPTVRAVLGAHGRSDVHALTSVALPTPVECAWAQASQAKDLQIELAAVATLADCQPIRGTRPSRAGNPAICRPAA